MTLPNFGVPMTAAMINVELGRAAGAAFSLNDAAVRALAGKPTGAISFNDFYGKSATAFSAVASPSFISEQGTTNTIDAAQNGTATPTGGTGPFTYQWTANQYGGQPITLVGATSQVVAFRATGMSVPGTTAEAGVYCTVTDTSNAAVAVTGEIYVYLERV